MLQVQLLFPKFGIAQAGNRTEKRRARFSPARILEAIKRTFAGGEGDGYF
jgi:hypothetical protein